MSKESFCYETCPLFKYQEEHGNLPERSDNCARLVTDSLKGGAVLHFEDGKTEIETAIGNLLLRLSERYTRMADDCASYVEAVPQDQRSSPEVVEEVALDTATVESAVKAALGETHIQDELERLRRR